MGERLLCKQEVIGSIPFTSTIGPSAIGMLAMDVSAGGVRRSEKLEEIPPGFVPGAGLLIEG